MPELLEAAEESGLLWVLLIERRAVTLPSGSLWGLFKTERAAAEAFQAAVRKASTRLGYAVPVLRVLTVKLSATDADDECDTGPAISTSDFEQSLLQQLFGSAVPDLSPLPRRADAIPSRSKPRG
jgi:hypothetical protein